MSSGAATLTSTELTNPEGKITFDDQGFTGAIGWDYSVGTPEITLTNSSLIPSGHTVKIGGSSCMIYKNNFYVNYGFWNGDTDWSGGNTKPGYFLTVSDGAACYITFDPPIYSFSMRINNDDRRRIGTLKLYDSSDQELGCTPITGTEDTTVNTYQVQGIDSLVPLISKIDFSGFLVTIDEIGYNTCGDGYLFSGGVCGGKQKTNASLFSFFGNFFTHLFYFTVA
jgi:hypothetical protein